MEMNEGMRSGDAAGTGSAGRLPKDGHVVLLGDSIFDAYPYLEGLPGVREHLRTHLPAGWRVSMLAVDGAFAADVAGQLQRLPADATHLVVSAGGNDALRSALRLGDQVRNLHEALGVLADLREWIEQDYGRALDALQAVSPQVTAVTIYDHVPDLTREERVMLGIYNDVIVACSAMRGVPVVDIRPVCVDPEDYSRVSSIEPSSAGAGKIARALAQQLFGKAAAR